MNLASENLLGEAASADIKAAEEFPEKLKKIIDGKILCKTNRKKEFCSVFTTDLERVPLENFYFSKRPERVKKKGKLQL